MKFPQIGEVLPNGHVVDAAYCVGANRYVLAHRDGAPEPYAVWSVDQHGNTWGGKYFIDPIRAQQCFASRCYDQPNSFRCDECKERIIRRFWEELRKEIAKEFTSFGSSLPDEAHR